MRSLHLKIHLALKNHFTSKFFNSILYLNKLNDNYMKKKIIFFVRGIQRDRTISRYTRPMYIYREVKVTIASKLKTGIVYNIHEVHVHVQL